jgi:hypothetical protein
VLANRATSGYSLEERGFLKVYFSAFSDHHCDQHQLAQMMLHKVVRFANGHE